MFIGGDNRPSTRGLLDLVAKGVNSQKGKVIDFGEGRDLALANPNTQEWGNVGVRAPEAKSLKACELGDVWSFGMLTLYLLTPSERGWIDWSDCN